MSEVNKEQEIQDPPEEQVPQDQDTKTAVEKILERHGAKTEKEQPEEKEVKSEEKSEKSDKEVQVTPEALEEYKELGYTQEDLEQFDAKELKNILKKQLKKEVKEVKTGKEQPLVITEELARQDKTGFLKNMVGQPIDKMLESFNSQAYTIQNLQKELNELRNKPTDTKTIEEEVEAIDLVELEPKEQAKAILSIVNKSVQTALENNNKEWESKFQKSLQPLMKTAEREALNDLYGKLQKKLPKELKAEEVFQKWLGNSGLSQEGKLALAQSEDALIEVVSAYGKDLNQQILNEKTEKESKKKSKITVYNEIRKKMKEADNTAVEGSQFNATDRSKPIYRDERTNEVVQRIIARNFSS